jgi:hypothetical protein
MKSRNDEYFGLDILDRINRVEIYIQNQGKTISFFCNFLVERNDCCDWSLASIAGWPTKECCDVDITAAELLLFNFPGKRKEKKEISALIQSFHKIPRYQLEAIQLFWSIYIYIYIYGKSIYRRWQSEWYILYEQ